MIPQFLVMRKDLVLSFNETTWELKFIGKEEKVFEQVYPNKPETRKYDVYEVFLNGKNYKKIKVKIFSFSIDEPSDLTNVHIYGKGEYLGNTFFRGKDVNLDEMIDIIKWVKFYTESK